MRSLQSGYLFSVTTDYMSGTWGGGGTVSDTGGDLVLVLEAASVWVLGPSLFTPSSQRSLDTESVGKTLGLWEVN